VPTQQQQPYANYQAQVGQPGYPGQPTHLGQPRKKSKGPLIGIISVSAAVLIVAVVLLFTFVIMPTSDNKTADDPAIIALPPNPTPLTDPVDPTPTPVPSTDDYVPELGEEYHSDTPSLTLMIGDRWKRKGTENIGPLYLDSAEGNSSIMFYEIEGASANQITSDVDAFLEYYAEGLDADDIQLIKQGKVKLGSQTWYEIEVVISSNGLTTHEHTYFIDSPKGVVVATLLQTESSQGSTRSKKDEADMLAMLGTVTFGTSKSFD
jgi:hypothetical protein